jgi:hypothetical protein
VQELIPYLRIDTTMDIYAPFVPQAQQGAVGQMMDMVT